MSPPKVRTSLDVNSADPSKYNQQIDQQSTKYNLQSGGELELDLQNVLQNPVLEENLHNKSNTINVKSLKDLSKIAANKSVENSRGLTLDLTNGTESRTRQLFLLEEGNIIPFIGK